ncbi:MAG: type II toxin-antitoxin system VapC family toxin [Verrucomicrobia bacterium]|nr:type II toxin-antitoxin system VapC family toxin [Verrucomicrobiota bacterium]
MILLDVNILVYAHREDAERHPDYKAWLESALGRVPGVAVSDLALSGFIRLVTHPKIFLVPTPLADALGFVEDLRSRDLVKVLAPGPMHWKVFLDLCRKADARGNLVPDAYHAALAVETGCEWVTADRGFSRFPGLKWRHPLE